MLKRSRHARVAMDVPSPEVMAIEEVRRVTIVGAGTMGQQIGFQCAGHGYDVVLYDIDPAVLEAASGRIDTYAEMLQTGGVITSEVAASARARITMTADLQTAAWDADLLSEAVPEDPGSRRLQPSSAACPPGTIFQRRIPLDAAHFSQFARVSGRGDRLLALHFHLPVWINNLADVMPHPGTAPEVTQLVLVFADRIGQVPIELKRETCSCSARPLRWI